MPLAILKTLFAQKTWANAELFDAMHLVDRIFGAHLLGEAHGYTQITDCP